MGSVASFSRHYGQPDIPKYQTGKFRQSAQSRDALDSWLAEDRARGLRFSIVRANGSSERLFFFYRARPLSVSESVSVSHQYGETLLAKLSRSLSQLSFFKFKPPQIVLHWTTDKGQDKYTISQNNAARSPTRSLSFPQQFPRLYSSSAAFQPLFSSFLQLFVKKLAPLAPTARPCRSEPKTQAFWTVPPHSLIPATHYTTHSTQPDNTFVVCFARAH
ncbi:LANO_0D02102g1_1 [Lachancea nothofagi CBS 11611]|uniref:LANO_0D02102g1_1 n=1 Tax=Lachancea nothofagi CBS 11611 TaxID=1266666 RepID=A0A1G4JE10_9SACH|nr:LANO_0D02102g1_1 [Lachancea nothofagi CBS 11611]